MATNRQIEAAGRVSMISYRRTLQLRKAHMSIILAQMAVAMLRKDFETAT